MDANAQARARYCCTLDCDRDAEYEARFGAGIYDWTDLCAVCAEAEGWTREELHLLGHECSLAEEDAADHEN